MAPIAPTQEVASPRPSTGSLALIAALVLVPASAGLVIALIADRSTPTLLLLLAEPLVWAVLAAGALWSLVERRAVPAMATSAGLMLFAAFVRWPVHPVAAPPPPPDLDDAVRACIAGVPPPRDSVRVVTWNASRAESADAAALLALSPDIIVLHDVPDDRFAAALASGGSLVHTPLPGLAVITPNGSFHACSDTVPADRWSFPLPGLSTRRGGALLVIAELPRIGAVPVVAAWFDRPRSALELPGWSDRLQQSASLTAGLIHSLPSPAVLLAVDTSSHGTFRQLHEVLASPPLVPSPGLPTWPARLGRVPVPTLYHGDRVWHGHAWQVRAARTARIGQGHHLAYTADLTPTRR